MNTCDICNWKHSTTDGEEDLHKGEWRDGQGEVHQGGHQIDINDRGWEDNIADAWEQGRD